MMKPTTLNCPTYWEVLNQLLSTNEFSTGVYYKLTLDNLKLLDTLPYTDFQFKQVSYFIKQNVFEPQTIYFKYDANNKIYSGEIIIQFTSSDFHGERECFVGQYMINPFVEIVNKIHNSFPNGVYLAASSNKPLE